MAHLSWGLKSTTEKELAKSIPTGYSYNLKWDTKESSVVINTSIRFIITDGERWHGVTERGTYKLSKAKKMLEEVSFMNQIDRHIVNEAIGAFFG